MSLAVVQHHVVLHPLRAESDKEGVVDSHTSLDELEGDQLEDGRGHNVPVHSVEGVGELVTELNQLMGNLGDRTSGENGEWWIHVHVLIIFLFNVHVHVTCTFSLKSFLLSLP